MAVTSGGATMPRETLREMEARHEREFRADQRKLLIAIVVSVALLVVGIVMLGITSSWADALGGLVLAVVALLFGLVVGMVRR